MTDGRQLALFADCPWGGCEDGYCACLEQDVDPEDFEDDEEISGSELASLYGLDAEEIDRFSHEELVELLAGLTSGRTVIHGRRIRSVDTVPDIASYTPDGVHA